MLVMIPIVEGLAETYENPEARSGSPEDRWAHFQQKDHVRLFGRDFRKLVTDVGFHLEEFTAQGDLAARYGLIAGETVFVLRPAPAPRVQGMT